jgi:Fibronectin type III domain
MEYTHQTTGSRGKNSYSATQSFWLILAVTAFIGIGPAAECLAFTVSPTALTFNAAQDGKTPPDQTLSVSRSRTNQRMVTTSDNASWLTVSPATTSMTTLATLTVAVNTSGLAAGTYNATITVKVGKATETVPVTMTLSSSPSATTATLAWNVVTDPSLSGYNVKVGTTSGLYSRTITVGNVTSYTVDSLTTGTTYFFSVTAYNSAGESLPSNEVSKSIY